MGSCNSSGRQDAVMGVTENDPRQLNTNEYIDTSSQAARRLRRRREIRLREEVRLAEIYALQQSLAAMDEFFQSLLGQAQLYHMEQAFDPLNGGNTGPPPASRSLILPKIDTPFHATCGVCCEPMNEKATQMPCGHLFHSISCIDPWLQRHCTCPVCRYEVTTDDVEYEVGRVTRMSARPLLPILKFETTITPPTLYDDIVFEPIEHSLLLESQANNTDGSSVQELHHNVLQRHCRCSVCLCEEMTDDDECEEGGATCMSSQTLPQIDHDDADTPPKQYQNIVLEPVMEHSWERQFSANDADDSSARGQLNKVGTSTFRKSNQASHYDGDESSIETQFLEEKDAHEVGVHGCPSCDERMNAKPEDGLQQPDDLSMAFFSSE